jgi:MFS transporter, BCD family, chlorophyll transporter
MIALARPDLWHRLGSRFLPFADAASAELPLSRLMRLSLFQVSAGMAFVLLNFTLNRVMIVELGVPASLVAAMIALPLLFAPLRALIGHRSDHHRSALGWRRVPYIWFGTLLQFGGLAIMPFALLLMTGAGLVGGAGLGIAGACLAFLLVGAGLATTQTAGLALATDLSPDHLRPKVVALLSVMLLIGMFVASLVFGQLLVDFTPTRLVQVIQGTAALTMIVNVLALWKQEARRPPVRDQVRPPDFGASWRVFMANPRTRRLLVAIGLGAAGFGMQDVLLEPYGGHVLGLSVSETTLISSLWSAGMLVGFGIAARGLARATDPHRLAGYGVVIGIAAFLAVIFAAAAQSTLLLALGAAGIGIGGGLFSVGTLLAAMDIAEAGSAGLALGAWGAVQASAAGVAIAASGLMRDATAHAAEAEMLGRALIGPATGYLIVYLCEIGLLLATLVALGPLVRPASQSHRIQEGDA